jgi:hypothetical protein
MPAKMRFATFLLLNILGALTTATPSQAQNEPRHGGDLVEVNMNSGAICNGTNDSISLSAAAPSAVCLSRISGLLLFL